MRAAVAAVVGLILGFAAGWALAPVPPAVQEQVKELEEDVASTRKAADEAGELKSRVERDARDGARRLAELEREAQASREVLEAALKEIEDLRAAAAAVVPLRDPGDTGPAVPFEEFQEAFAAVDWRGQMGENIAALVPHIESLVDSLSKGEQPTPDAMGGVQRHNGPLLTAAMTLNNAGVPGDTVNSTFSHPSVMVNMLIAGLEAAGVPANAGQLADLERIGRDYVARDAKRRAAYDDSTYALRKSIDETRLKAEFFDAAFAVLTDEQLLRLRPQAVRDRTQLDIFSEAILWSGRLVPLEFSDRDDLKAQVRAAARRQLRIPADQQAGADAVVDAWVDALPDGSLTRSHDALSRLGMMPVEAVIEGAPLTLKLFESLVDTLVLDDLQREHIRDYPVSMTFFRR